ncbi:MgtC/SapB family protein [Dethiobacter alkaliphilus]|uniref:MgtC/SapB transporter n=1 Tax=Dethiobacter alkaliphilus AHT 1 TaxID=555088 RepID=C0GF54_DETAL|nr:MgtC/SapB family protein [Dethiobacter alkaliphilus]EEG78236.1 MgtC/SapB transporter [Dethiobacter alkaliphilus AHT 1]MCW3491434.1 MgtC/SapB family protein [Dethiobacter alkaliphilus]
MPGLAEWEIVLRLVLAGVLGGLVGYERERHNRPAGLRTHILVCLGSALVMIVSVAGFDGRLGPVGDQGRIAAQVVSGIGFLGAGTIMRQGSAVRGLTTAASIWVVAAVGLATGIGLYMAAATATGLVLLSLFSLTRVEELVARGRCNKSLWVRAVDQPGLLGRIGTVLGDHGVGITNVSLTESNFMEAYKADTVAIELTVNIPVGFNSQRLMEQLLRVPGMLEVSWEGEDPGVCALPQDYKK